MATWQYKTFFQSGPETFEAGQPAQDIIVINTASLIATFPTLAAGDVVQIRQKSGLRAYVPELCYIHGDTATTTAVNLEVDGGAGVLVTAAAFAGVAKQVQADSPGAFNYALANNTPDAGSIVQLRFTGAPTGTGNYFVAITTRPAQA
ncbi:hypothetical protein [Dokdonella soli]|uniref:DUF2190 family protein n=1 Tax=Dokdonella soli TaxID=529810 RepID=A0ABN1ITZ7_9GAMM